jgi:NADPH:quinone reductase-like Zn-dependent oxidoreductase
MYSLADRSTTLLTGWPSATEEKKESRKRMYALQLSTFGDPSEVIELVTLPDPEPPKANEVLVAMEYAPINGSDLLTIRGQYGRLPSLPTGLGSEGVGRILSVGEEADNLKVGDRVLLLSPAPSWREKIILPSTRLVLLPHNADPQQLSMLSINPPTAALLLSEYVELKPGDWVIQNAGNSGVGRSVIAFAKDRGLRTVSLVRRPELLDELVAAGGDIVQVDGAEISARVAQATGNAKVALAIDGVGGEATLSLSSCLSPGGTLVLYFAVSSKPSLASFVDLVYRTVTIRGFWLANPAFHASPKLMEAITTGARLIAEGKLHQPVAAIYPLVAAKEAIAHAQRGGKVLFKFS